MGSSGKVCSTGRYDTSLTCDFTVTTSTTTSTDDMDPPHPKEPLSDDEQLSEEMLKSLDESVSRGNTSGGRTVDSIPVVKSNKRKVKNILDESDNK